MGLLTSQAGVVGRFGRVCALLWVLAGLVLMAAPSASLAAADPERAGATLQLERPSGGAGGTIPEHFVGFSVEWSLIERYMGRNARPAFADLLANLGTGVLRIGGSSQDLMQFDPAAANTTG